MECPILQEKNLESGAQTEHNYLFIVNEGHPPEECFMSGTRTASRCYAVALYLSHLIYTKPYRGGLNIYANPSRGGFYRIGFM